MIHHLIRDSLPRDPRAQKALYISLLPLKAVLVLTFARCDWKTLRRLNPQLPMREFLPFWWRYVKDSL